MRDARAYRATQDLLHILNSGEQNKEDTEIKQYENPKKTVLWDICMCNQMVTSEISE